MLCVVTNEGLVMSKFPSLPIASAAMFHRQHTRFSLSLSLSLLTTLNVLWENPDVHIPIWSALLVPAPQGVKHLVQYDPLKLTAAPNGDVLGSTNTANVGEAPVISISCQ